MGFVQVENGNNRILPHPVSRSLHLRRMPEMVVPRALDFPPQARRIVGTRDENAWQPSSAQIVCHIMWYVLVVTLTLNFKGYKFALKRFKRALLSRGSPFYKSSHSPFNLFIATHCWYCGPAKGQDACDKEIQYRECETFGPSICIAVNGLSQTYYMRTCLSKYDYDWEKWKCETRNFGGGIRSGRGMLCEIGRCSGDCIANVGK